MNINIVKLTTLALAFCITTQAAAQNIIDTYSVECKDTFTYLLNKNRTNLRYVRDSKIENAGQLQNLFQVEKDAYKVYRDRKLYNYLTPVKGQSILLGTAQYVDYETEQLVGFRVEFKMGTHENNKIRLFYVINNQRTQLLYIGINQPTQKNFWVCQGFDARPAKADMQLYKLANDAGPYFDYAATPYQFNVKELDSVQNLPKLITVTGENYRNNQMKLRPDYRFEWAHQQHVVTANGKALGYVVAMNYFKKDHLLDGGGIYLFLNNQGKIITERHWRQ